jgi:hypothetical protein
MLLPARADEKGASEGSQVRNKLFSEKLKQKGAGLHFASTSFQLNGSSLEFQKGTPFGSSLFLKKAGENPAGSAHVLQRRPRGL